MRRIRWSHVLLAVLLAFGLLQVPSGQTMAQGVVDDEIALIEYPSGVIRIVPSGVTPFTWNSPDTGWGNVAAGDFNGDGDAELAAVRVGTLKVFDPKQQPGSALVSFETTLAGNRTYRLLTTGDLDNDDRDEIIVTHTESNGQTLELWDGGPNGTTWTRTRSEFFSGAWDAVSSGDMNNDGRDDVALERRVDQRIKVYSGATTSVLAEGSRYIGRWLTLALGNISNSYPGDEMALTREDVDVQYYPNLILFRLSTSGLSNLVDLAPYKYSPPFRSISLGDVNGDGDAEVLLLRDPLSNKTALLLVNPAGAPMRNFESSLEYPLVWSQVRTGDLDADGRDEIVVLRQDRYRIYWQAELDNSSQDFTGSFRIPSQVDSDRPTMAIANYDGQGSVNGPLVVSPTSISAVRRAGAPMTVRTISITRAGASTGWVATENPDLPGVTLAPNSGNTPATLNVNITENALGPYFTTIRIQATDSGVSDPVHDVPLNLWVTDKSVFLPLILK